MPKAGFFRQLQRPKPRTRRRSEVISPASAPGRGNWRQQARLFSGLILFAFCLSHFLNHALGIWSLDLLRQGEALHHEIWGDLPGLAVLSLAALTHASLALWRTARRRTLRLPVWETLQLALGGGHIVTTVPNPAACIHSVARPTDPSTPAATETHRVRSRVDAAPTGSHPHADLTTLPSYTSRSPHRLGAVGRSWLQFPS